MPSDAPWCPPVVRIGDTTTAHLLCRELIEADGLITSDFLASGVVERHNEAVDCRCRGARVSERQLFGRLLGCDADGRREFPGVSALRLTESHLDRRLSGQHQPERNG